MRNSSALLLPGLQCSIYNLAVQLVQAATHHVADKFLAALALVLKLEGGLPAPAFPCILPILLMLVYQQHSRFEITQIGCLLFVKS
jgi:hypothetical protein